MAHELREYQRKAVAAVWNYLAGGNRGAPLVVLPTGSGKSHVIAQLSTEVCARFNDAHVLIVSHRASIVRQNASKLHAIANIPIGIYSAGLGQKRVARITVANIQSIYKHAFKLPPISILMIDEAHLVPDSGEGQYRRFITELKMKNENLIIVGFTATAYRQKQGLLTEGEGKIFTDVISDASVVDLIEQGFLSPLVGKGGRTEARLQDVHISNGEYVGDSAAEVMDEITEAAVSESIALAAGRKSWLVFCSGVDHVRHVVRALNSQGVAAEEILGEMDEQSRARVVGKFEAGEIRALVSCDVLTTGFDSPQVDLIVLLRPTRSTSLYVQMLGRGMRLAPGKTNCMVLDFAGNLERHGPIDKIRIGPRNRDGRSQLELAPVKFCPQCQTMNILAAKECLECGYEFSDDSPAHERTAAEGSFIEAFASLTPVLRSVTNTRIVKHKKAGKPPSLRADYIFSMMDFVSEWVCFEHEGLPRRKAEAWWKEHGGYFPTPKTVEEALERVDELREVFGVYVTKDGEYDRVIGATFEPVEDGYSERV